MMRFKLFLNELKHRLFETSVKSKFLYPEALLNKQINAGHFDEIYAKITQSEFFKTLSHKEKLRLSHIAKKVDFYAGEMIFSENQASDCFYIILQGEALIFRNAEGEYGEQQEHVIAEISEDAIVGEMSLNDSATRSASIRAVTEMRALKIDYDLLKSDNLLFAAIERCIAAVSVIRLRKTNDAMIASIKKQLQEANARNVLGSFMVTLFWLLSLYTLSLTSLIALKTLVPNTTPLSVMLMVVLSIALILTAVRTGLPMRMFGLTTHNWKSSVVEAIKLSVIICLLGTLIKYAYIVSLGLVDKAPLFNPYSLASFYQHKDLKTYFITVLAYVVVCPMQELLGRGMLQSTFYNFLPGKEGYRKWNSIILSNLLFAALHSHLNLLFSFIALLPGLFWGWLYYRQKNIIGVSVSHIIIGVYAIFGLGKL